MVNYSKALPPNAEAYLSFCSNQFGFQVSDFVQGERWESAEHISAIVY